MSETDPFAPPTARETAAAAQNVANDAAVAAKNAQDEASRLVAVADAYEVEQEAIAHEVVSEPQPVDENGVLIPVPEDNVVSLSDDATPDTSIITEGESVLHQIEGDIVHVEQEVKDFIEKEIP